MHQTPIGFSVASLGLDQQLAYTAYCVTRDHLELRDKPEIGISNNTTRGAARFSGDSLNIQTDLYNRVKGVVSAGEVHADAELVYNLTTPEQRAALAALPPPKQITVEGWKAVIEAVRRVHAKNAKRLAHVSEILTGNAFLDEVRQNLMVKAVKVARSVGTVHGDDPDYLFRAVIVACMRTLPSVYDRVNRNRRVTGSACVCSECDTPRPTPTPEALDCPSCGAGPGMTTNTLTYWHTGVSAKVSQDDQGRIIYESVPGCGARSLDIHARLEVSRVLPHLPDAQRTEAEAILSGSYKLSPRPLARLMRTVRTTARILRGVKDFRGDDLRGVHLRGKNLAETDFTGANLTGADLRDTDLSMATLAGSTLVGVDLRGADLRNADLEGALLRRVSFSGARADGVDFTDATIETIRWGDVRLDDATFDGASIAGTRPPGVPL